MKYDVRSLLLIAGLFVVPFLSNASNVSAILESQHRSEENKARDQYRNPEKVIEFFDIKPQHNVLEILPGTGWYSEILAPYLKTSGKFSAATFTTYLTDDEDPRGKHWSRIARDYREKMADKSLFGDVNFYQFENCEFVEGTPEEMYDRVLLIRSMHIWDEDGQLNTCLEKLWEVMKPGAILGIVQHRANSISKIASEAVEGYMDQRYVTEAVIDAGFELQASSEINSNNNDTKDYPKGVYTLPPTLAMGKQDREKYLAIGESDRMTLKFVKPAS